MQTEVIDQSAWGWGKTNAWFHYGGLPEMT
jgi:hypothetical protein